MGLTLLHWAVKKNDFEMVTTLLESRIEPNVDFFGAVLREKQDDDAWNNAEADKDRKNKYMFYRWKSDPNQGDIFNRTPLFLAVQ